MFNFPEKAPTTSRPCRYLIETSGSRDGGGANPTTRKDSPQSRSQRRETIAMRLFPWAIAPRPQRRRKPHTTPFRPMAETFEPRLLPAGSPGDVLTYHNDL